MTPEDRPLALFGTGASESVATLLDDRGIQVLTRRHPVRLEGGELLLAPVERMSVDCVVALPQLEGPHLPGLPSDDHGFITTDLHGLVDGLENIYAAGDATAFPVKQGGLATQQADAVAESLAARAARS